MYLDNAYQFAQGLVTSPFNSSWGMALFTGAVPADIKSVAFDMSKADEVFKNAECQMNLTTSIPNGDSVRFLRKTGADGTRFQNKIHFLDESVNKWYYMPQEANIVSPLKADISIQDKLAFMGDYGSIFNNKPHANIDFSKILETPTTLEIEYVYNEEVEVSAIHALSNSASYLGTTLNVFVRNAEDDAWIEIGTGLTNAFNGIKELGASASGTKFKVVSTCTGYHTLDTLLLCGTVEPTQAPRDPVTWAMVYPKTNPAAVYELSQELPVIIMDAGGPNVQLPLTLNSATAIAEIPFNVINLKISSPYLEESA